MKKVIFFFLYLIIYTAEAQVDQDIHWNVILPNNFLSINKTLNKDRDLILKSHVMELAYKFPVDYIKDSSRVFYNANGDVSKEILNGRDVEVRNAFDGKLFKQNNFIVLNRNFEYDENRRISRINYFYFEEDGMRKMKPYCGYLISYKNDSLMDKIIVKDSMGIDEGKIELTYKNNRIEEEKCFWKGKLCYTIKHDYLVDLRTKEVVKETTVFNEIEIGEKLYYLGKPIIKTRKDANSSMEFYDIDLCNNNRVEIEIKKYNRYAEFESNARINKYTKEGKIITTNDITGLYPYNYKLIYNAAGLLEKEIQVNKKDNSEAVYIEYVYKYGK